MPTTSFNRYSALSSSSVSSSTSSTNAYNQSQHYSSSQSSSSYLPLRCASSSHHLSKLFTPDYHSMQSLKIQPSSSSQVNHLPIARVSPLVMNQQIDLYSKDENWLSCDELESIEKRFTDLLQNTTQKKSLDYQRAKSCDRLTLDEQNYKPTTMTIARKSLIDKTERQNRRSRAHTPPPPDSAVLSSNEILQVESSYRSIGTQVYASRCLCDLYITTAERLAKLEDWILFQHGLPVWLLNSGTNPKRPSRLSLMIAEYGSGFPIWQENINGQSDIKQAREQHITFRLSDHLTLAVLRFNDINASKDFFSYYISIRNDQRYKHLFTQGHSRSSSCGAILNTKRQLPRHVNKSSISNPCQFQHITRLQVKDRARLTSLNRCLMPSQTYSNEFF